MKKIVFYLLFLLILSVASLFYIYFDAFVNSKQTLQLIFYCISISLIGGVINCLRGVYEHKSFKKDWDKDWEIWYFIRPILSSLMGFISFIFIRAGLIVFSSQNEVILKNNFWGYLAVAFIAGYNVKYFLEKLQEIGVTIWGIKKSGSYKEDKK
jgi:hypothetical protein